MRQYTNPLNNIRIASPCSANWNEMYGNDRKRFCGDCKLNVYNLSDMTRQEAENLLLTSEGRLCVRFFRRADGTVLTKNCPVGWQAVKRRVSRAATAALSVVLGFFSGMVASRVVDSEASGEAANGVPPIEVPAVPIWQGEEEVTMPEEVGQMVVPVAGDVDLIEFRKAMKAKTAK